MTRSDYLVVGSSHAGLAAVDAIRTLDPDGIVTLLSRENRPPYSPTVLPHVLTGRVRPESARIREAGDLERLEVDLRPGSEVTAVEPGNRRVVLDSGEGIEYGKLLLATGASPALPPLPGLDRVPFHVLRTLDDAVRLRRHMLEARRAVVLGAGLIGLHAAECLLQGGCTVTVVEALPQVAPGYFDPDAARRLETVFTSHGVRILAGRKAIGVRGDEERVRVDLDAGDGLEADLLLLAAGVRCNTEYLAGSGIDVDQGVRVDGRMRTSAPDVWAAGDAAQAPPLFGEGPEVIPSVWNAVAQGRTAGLDMAGDPDLPEYAGAMAANTSGFFGHRAFSIGLGASPCEEEGLECERYESDTPPGFLKLVFREGCLVGAAGVDVDPDPGVLAELIRRGVDLSVVRGELSREPRDTARVLMSRTWG
jgi:phenylglyoxylate dehydrogenase epsilon subunit